MPNTDAVDVPPPGPFELSRRGLLTAAVGGTAAVALPAWPATAEPSPDPGSGAPVLDTHPATEPSGSHVRRISGTGVLFAYGAVVPAFDGWRSPEPTRRHLPLDGRWRFAFDPDVTGLAQGWHRPDHDDSGWGGIGVPSAWDLLDTPGFGSLDGTDFGRGTAFADGYAWYRRTLTLDGSWQRRHLRLNFLAVGYSAEVWLDGESLGKHEGASSPFSLPVPERLATTGEHTLAVRVFRKASFPDYATNADPVTDDYEIPYKPVDYWPYAGITHSVWLEGAARTWIPKVLLAADGDRLRARVVVENHDSRAFSGTVRLDPGAGSGAAAMSRRVAVPSRSVVVVAFDLDVTGAPRWSEQSPTVLTARVTLTDVGAGAAPGPVDSLTAGYGLRDVEVRGSTLRMDGEQLLLKGLNWHEETAASGRTMSVEQYDTELGHVTALRANFIRNCVYVRHPHVYDWADRHGVMVMDDVDTMWMNTAQERLQTEEYGLSRAMALSMAWNQHNHPSVILWCLQNESEIDAGEAPVYRAWLADMKAATQAVDLSRRPVTWASSTTFDPAFDLADVVGVNEYFGYFYGESADLGPALDVLHASHPDKPVLITENGTWSLTDGSVAPDETGSEEWQAAYIGEHWEQVVARESFMAGYTLWVLKDYKQRLGYNQTYNGVSVLGLLTFDTEQPKLAYDAFRRL